MNKSATSLIFISCLSALTCPRVPLYFEITLIELKINRDLWVYDRYGDGGSVNAPFALSWRYPLDTMATALSTKSC
jgi:hypothetical protein